MWHVDIVIIPGDTHAKVNTCGLIVEQEYSNSYPIATMFRNLYVRLTTILYNFVVVLEF